MKNISTAVMAILLTVLTGIVVRAQSGNELYSQAIVKEKSGSYEEAFKLYETILQKYASDKKLAAKALFQMGQDFENIGNAVEARKVYTRITSDFTDQKELAADAGKRLVELTVQSPAEKVPTRFVMSSTTRDVLNRGSLSADGRWMVLADDSGDVAIRDMSTGKLVRLNAKAGGKNDRGAAEFLTLSPDASQVAYTWYDGSNYQLRVMPNAVGGTPQILVNNPEYDFWSAAWFPDGKSILGLVEKPDQTWQLLRIAVSDGHSETIKSLGWRIRPFTGSVRPVISPDGRYIAYAAIAGNPDKVSLKSVSDGQHIYVIAADGSGPETELVKNAGSNDSPVWTPDGLHILFVSNVSGTFDLWSIAVHSGQPSAGAEKLVANIGDIRPIALTTSGSFYYRQSRPVRPSKISIANVVSDRNASVQFADTFLGSGNVVWSPDGQFVAFYRATNADSQNSAPEIRDLVVRSVVSGQEQEFRNRPLQGQGTYLQWVDRNGLIETGISNDCYYVDLRSGKFKRIVAPPLAISSQKRSLFVVDPNSKGRLLSIDIDSMAEKEIMNVSNRSMEVVRGLSLSPDGSMLAVTTLDSTSRRTVFVARTDGSGYRETPLLTGNPIWTPDSKAILAVAPTAVTVVDKDQKSPPPNSRLVSVDVETLHETEVLTVTDGSQLDSAIRFSPDGRRLVVTRYISTTKGNSPFAFPAAKGFIIAGVDGTNSQEFPVPTEEVAWPTPVWVSANEAIQLSAPVGGTLQFLRIRMNGGPPETTELAVSGLQFVVLSTDGTRVAFVTDGSASNEMLAVDNVLRALKN
jgi:Tol biopolymer transport system component